MRLTEREKRYRAVKTLVDENDWQWRNPNRNHRASEAMNREIKAEAEAYCVECLENPCVCEKDD